MPGPGRGGARRLSAALAAVAIVATTFLTTGAENAHADPSGEGARQLTDVGAVVDRVLPDQLEKGRIPGAIVTVVAGGETVFSKGYGVADVDSSAPMDPEETGFYTASEAKLFTAAAALQLVEAGKLDLHTDVNEYLRDFSVPDRYPGSPVTLHHLLTYTSGFDNNIYGWSQWPYDRMPSLAEFAAEMQPERVRPPGELSAYNNYDYVLIGRLIEVASGMSFADYVGSHVFDPLGMASTSAQQPHTQALESQLATGYRPGDGGQVETAGQDSPVTPSGADVISTAPDIARFMIAQLDQDQELGSGVAAMMQQQQFTADAQIPGMGYAFEQRPRNGQPVVLKDGDLPGFHHNMALLPELDVGIHVVYNGDGTNQAAFWGGKELVNTIIDTSFPADEPPPVEPVSADASEYAGVYRDTRTSQTSFTGVSGLMEPITVEAAGAGRLTTSGLSEDPSVHTQHWVQTEPGLFRLKGGAATIAFDGSGALVSSQTPNAGYTKLDWWASPRLHLPVAGVTALIMITGFALIPIRMLVRRVRHRDPRPIGARVATALAWMTSLCVVMFTAGFAIVAADPNRLMQIPLTGDLILSITLNTMTWMSVFTLTTIIATIVAWRRRWWTSTARIAHSCFTLAAVLLLGIAIDYWLIGFPMVITV